MPYLRNLYNEHLVDAHERPALCALEAAVVAADQALRRRHPHVDFWTPFPPAPGSAEQAAAHLLVNRLFELRDLIDFYECALRAATGHPDPDTLTDFIPF